MHYCIADSTEQSSVFDRFEARSINIKVGNSMDEHNGEQSLINMSSTCMIQLLLSKSWDKSDNLINICTNLNNIEIKFISFNSFF